MVINLRYFVITIIAIFLSLGIGILIGVIMDSQQIFITQQEQLVSGIEKEFYEFKEKNYQLLTELENIKRENSNKDIFLNNIFDYLIKDTLKGFNILTINVSEYQNYEDIINVLYNAGANRIIQMTIKEFDSEQVSIQIVEEVKELSLKIPVDYPDKIEDLLNQLLNNRVDANYSKEELSIDYGIIFDGSNRESNNKGKFMDIIVEGLKKRELPFIAVERSNIRYTAVPFYKVLGISTVDNIDTKLGQISMLMLIRGNEGNYGEKKAADKLMPENFFVFD